MRVSGQDGCRLRVSTRCRSIEALLGVFHRYVTEESLFIPTLATRPLGSEVVLSVLLADGKVALRGTCVVTAVWSNASNPFAMPGMVLEVKSLGERSWMLFRRMQSMRSGTPAPLARGSSDDLPTRRYFAPMAQSGPHRLEPALRTAPVDDDAFAEPTQETALPTEVSFAATEPVPANPLKDLTDQTIAAFVDCALYEDRYGAVSVMAPVASAVSEESTAMLPAWCTATALHGS
jgi:hypothetical protein